jgi:hypothetical protein
MPQLAAPNSEERAAYRASAPAVAVKHRNADTTGAKSGAPTLQIERALGDLSQTVTAISSVTEVVN